MKKRTKLIIAALVIAIIIPVIAYMFWPYFHLFKSDNVTIDNEDYFYYASIICHSESEFKKLPLGTTYAEIKDRFGLKNGWYNHSGAFGSYFYIVGPNRYIIINLRASNDLIEYTSRLTNEEFRARSEELMGKTQLISISCATDTEILWVIDDRLEGFFYYD